MTTTEAKTLTRGEVVSVRLPATAAQSGREETILARVRVAWASGVYVEVDEVGGLLRGGAAKHDRVERTSQVPNGRTLIQEHEAWLANRA